jgi:hypothetical protein
LILFFAECPIVIVCGRGCYQARLQGELLLKVGDIVLDLGGHLYVCIAADLDVYVTRVCVPRFATKQAGVPNKHATLLEDWVSLREHQWASGWHFIALLAS